MESKEEEQQRRLLLRHIAELHSAIAIAQHNNNSNSNNNSNNGNSSSNSNSNTSNNGNSRNATYLRPDRNKLVRVDPSSRSSSSSFNNEGRKRKMTTNLTWKKTMTVPPPSSSSPLLLLRRSKQIVRVPGYYNTTLPYRSNYFSPIVVGGGRRRMSPHAYAFASFHRPFVSSSSSAMKPSSPIRYVKSTFGNSLRALPSSTRRSPTTKPVVVVGSSSSSSSSLVLSSPAGISRFVRTRNGNLIRVTVPIRSPRVFASSSSTSSSSSSSSSSRVWIKPAAVNSIPQSQQQQQRQPLSLLGRNRTVRFFSPKSPHRNLSLGKSSRPDSAKTKKKEEEDKKAKRQFCIFYNRFGKCNKGDKCPYVHDPSKVAVCTRFLKGMCVDADCPFSHKLDKDKMPVCYHFLKGTCLNEKCPYLHVKVSDSAAVCPDFLKGYCIRGAACPLRHVFECPDFAATGNCPKGDKCKLAHIQRRTTRRTLESSSNLEQTPDEFRSLLRAKRRKRTSTTATPTTTTTTSESLASPAGTDSPAATPIRTPSTIRWTNSVDANSPPDTPSPKMLSIQPHFQV